MVIGSVTLVRAWDRDTGAKIMIDGKELARADYEEHGSDGLALLETIHRRLAEMAGVEPRVLDVEDEDFERAGVDHVE
ncbi:hypothetical protein LAZ40_09740 [Cereibacter sphaeroides]|uniref:hypothetical protein n=1 Tax=Cereibacter sphaeroides TaxID=1063 RepID=UPI001F24FD9A|nr:hypothetical protein [Cereibacter sphaeroides]MCE6959332.1 hypothetical protein [Cereibacter sphaeroides]MCE6972924.1 hypothetical protein [Cereibacter sphaeroides]